MQIKPEKIINYCKHCSTVLKFSSRFWKIYRLMNSKSCQRPLYQSSKFPSFWKFSKSLPFSKFYFRKSSDLLKRICLFIVCHFPPIPASSCLINPFFIFWSEPVLPWFLPIAKTPHPEIKIIRKREKKNRKKERGR